MKANYFKAIFLTLSMTATTNNILAMSSSVFPYTQEINQIKDDKEKESKDDIKVGEDRSNAPLLIVNGTGETAEFTINTGIYYCSQRFQYQSDNGTSQHQSQNYSHIKQYKKDN